MEHAAQNSLKTLHKIEAIEKELLTLKISVLKKFTPTGRKMRSFKGILKGVQVSDKDIALAKKGLCNKIKI
ncbi:MAG: hypothetical protein A3J24_13125 [Deltaproteobacteria bacterium RIFCSPLOWO2_02_FULL_53_8]|nr:MAG: hypothetical protein A3J24_13125 [Deltaproteobacteria bacterium RIFCSPLOWO2_02_FULL_53_8]